MSTPTWNPLPPITGPPIGSDTLAKSINDNPIIQTGTSILILSIIAIIVLIVLAFKRKIVVYDLQNIRYWILFYLIFFAFVGGCILIGLENSVSTAEDIRINRNTESLVFSIFSIFLFFMLSVDMYNTFNSGLFYGLIGVSVIFTGIVLCTIGISNSIQGFKYEQNTPLIISGLILFVYGLYGLMFASLTKQYMSSSKSKALLWSGCIAALVGLVLMITAGALGLKIERDGIYIPLSTTPITPGDLSCTNISRTVTYGFPWSTKDDIMRIIFRLNIGYLPPSGNPSDPFLPTSLVVLRNGTKKIFEFRYQAKKIFFDFFDNDGSIRTTLNIDITPTNQDTFYVSASILGYDDVGDNKLGSISLYNENGDAQTSQMFRDLFTSSKWGNNTTLEIIGGNIVDTASPYPSTRSVDSVQVCQKQNSNNFFNIPILYQISFVVVIVMLFIIFVSFLLPTNARSALGLSPRPSIPDAYIKTVQ
jgi:hypothetical protein